MKKYLRVELLSWDYPEQIEPKIEVWFTLDPGDTAVKIHSVEANEHYLKSIPKEGIMGRLMKRYFLRDGLAFLEELKYVFTGSRLRASEVIEIINGKRPEEPEEEAAEEEEPEEEVYPDFGEDEFLDAAVNILKNKKSCLNCKYLHKDNHTCKAFPEGIPEVYLTGRQHTKRSKKYNQKNNIVWEEDLDQKWLARERKRDRETETKVISCGVNGDKAEKIYNKLKKEGWEVTISSWETWPEAFTVYASRKKKIRGK